jgi:hypothetical protein
LLLVGVAVIAVLFGAAVSDAQPSCRWSDHEARLTSYSARIRGLEKEIADMIALKQKTENSEKVGMFTQQIAFKHSDLDKVVKAYERERLHVRFHHPDRNETTARKYSIQKLKSLEEIERAFGLDGRLDRIKRQVGIVFPAESIVEKDGSLLRGPASAGESDDEKPQRIRLVK